MSICTDISDIKDFPVDVLDSFTFLVAMVCDGSFRLGLLYTSLIILFLIIGITFIVYIFIQTVVSISDGSHIVNNFLNGRKKK